MIYKTIFIAHIGAYIVSVVETCTFNLPSKVLNKISHYALLMKTFLFS